ncbi:hypothetical protein E2C01_026734 [Portunus trituberculatus]|uniref:Uncharacterized protein n=1 Tax=Portunus trituberculatus TaxID=210409 RepID=A0A5B7EIY9_PORTR|nr:hypothetical protein [Portunus trituberculatus]
MVVREECAQVKKTRHLVHDTMDISVRKTYSGLTSKRDTAGGDGQTWHGTVTAGEAGGRGQNRGRKEQVGR